MEIFGQTKCFFGSKTVFSWARNALLHGLYCIFYWAKFAKTCKNDTFVAKIVNIALSKYLFIPGCLKKKTWLGSKVNLLALTSKTFSPLILSFFASFKIILKEDIWECERVFVANFRFSFVGCQIDKHNIIKNKNYHCWILFGNVNIRRYLAPITQFQALKIATKNVSFDQICKRLKDGQGYFI